MHVPCTPAVDEEEVGRLDVAVRHPHAVQVRQRAVGLRDARRYRRHGRAEAERHALAG